MTAKSNGHNENAASTSSPPLPDSLQSTILITYRSVGLGVYGALMRFAGMPLEKIALYMNSSQVSGNNQLRQAIQLTFQDGQRGKSFLTPYKVVGPASGVAWFLQYSVMGMVFQICDRALSTALGTQVIPYGSQLMEDPALDDINDNNTRNNNSDEEDYNSTTTMAKQGLKIILAPIIAGSVESVVSNRAEVQRFYSISKFSQVEQSLKWNPLKRLCGPAFIANASRNSIMSATSFVITPVLYRQYYSQEDKSKTSLFWFGLGINVFCGNAIAITQQSLWGRALDYAAPAVAKGEGSAFVARNIHYRTVIQDSLKSEGSAAFFTFPKWATRVLMNAPVQGTLPWFYNEILPLAEDELLSISKQVYNSVMGNSSMRGNKIARKSTKRAQDTRMPYVDDKNKTTATSPMNR
jgi:hypothetical protein